MTYELRPCPVVGKPSLTDTHTPTPTPTQWGSADKREFPWQTGKSKITSVKIIIRKAIYSKKKKKKKQYQKNLQNTKHILSQVCECVRMLIATAVPIIGRLLVFPRLKARDGLFFFLHFSPYVDH